MYTIDNKQSTGMGASVLYKLIIVDDEKRARDIVAKYIEQHNLGFEVAGCFSNGYEALTFLQSHKVDVVITDIKMPVMSGLELTKNIYKAMPGCNVIIISAYSEFEYAKKAIEYNVLNYIVKPINVKELIKTLEVLKNRLDEMHIREDNYLETITILREQFFTDIAMGGMNENDIPKRFEMLEFPFPLEELAGVFLSIKIIGLNDYMETRWKYGKERFGTALLNILKKRYNIQDIYNISQNDNSFVFIIINKDNLEVSQSISDCIEDIKNILKIDIIIEENYSFRNICEISNTAFGLQNEKEKIKLLVSYIKSSDLNSAKTLLTNLVSSKLDNKKEIEDFLLKLSIVFQNAGIMNRQPRLGNIDYSNHSELVNILVDKIMSSLHLDSYNGEDGIIQKAKKYIMENYNRDITRDEVAEYVYLNSAYFSRYFKQQTGENFYDYVVSVRMKNAVKLLLESEKIGEIVEKVGYRSRKHFLKVFKEYTGYTPMEYRKHVLKLEDSGYEEQE